MGEGGGGELESEEKRGKWTTIEEGERKDPGKKKRKNGQETEVENIVKVASHGTEATVDRTWSGYQFLRYPPYPTSF